MTTTLRSIPIVAALLSFAAGVAILQTRAELVAAVWVGLALVISIVGLLCARRRGKRVVAMASILAAAIVGFAYAAWRADLRLADALPPAWEGEDISIVGVVDELPRRYDRNIRFAFKVEHVPTSNAHVPARVSLSWQARADEAQAPLVHPGERWLLTVRLRRPHGTHNPGGFDLEAWLLERNLRATGYVRAGETNQRIDAFAARPSDYVQRAREAVRERALAALADAAHASVIVALAIGDQSGIDERAWKIFNRTGTGHLISISGLHVTVFAVLVGGLAFALTRLSVTLTSRIAARKLAVAMGLVAAFGYVQLAGAEIPAQRTLLMLAVAALGLWWARPGTGAVVWTWSLACVLAIDPWAVIAPGFWLSFFAVGLLIYVGNGRRGVERDVQSRLLAKFTEAVRSQWAITLGLIPLALALFQQVSLIGPLANAIAIPVVTFAIVPLALTASLLPIDAFWQLAHAVLAPLMRVLEWQASLPNAAWTQHEPPVWAVVAGIAGIALCLAPRGIPGRWLGALGVVPLFAALPSPPGVGAFRLVVLDVGQGTAALVQTHNRALLYDTGPRWTDVSDAGGRIVAPFLRAHGVRHVDTMLVSHRDIDHSGGALAVLDAVPVGFLISSLDDDHEIVTRNEERGLALRCRAGQHWEWDGVRFDVLFPGPEHYAEPSRKSNDLSCVLRVSAGGKSALLTGDIEAKSELDLLIGQREMLRSDILVVPHHGSRTSSTVSFVEAVTPRHAVFTVGYRNRFGHPRADIVARYLARDSSVYRTDVTGALTFEVGPFATGPPTSSRARMRRYWHETSG
ncbi:MAG TPA: DNA internalization-related competence protein ComEC/Rec2 [Casimicrobiaceae bacterium]|nr:DNA internalization-related competence protein ComEC/Rec2 [Casimicrobiaceae bacterium]